MAAAGYWFNSTDFYKNECCSFQDSIFYFYEFIKGSNGLSLCNRGKLVTTKTKADKLAINLEANIMRCLSQAKKLFSFSQKILMGRNLPTGRQARMRLIATDENG